jgi:hypothetical protein
MAALKATKPAADLSANGLRAIDRPWPENHCEANLKVSEKQPRRGGRSSRDKGNRAERALVRYFQARGFAAERVPLSGSAGGSYLGDLTIPVLGRDLVVEVKVRATGFAQLYAWLIDRDVLIVRADRAEPLVILPLHLAAEIAIAAERGKAVRP